MLTSLCLTAFLALPSRGADFVVAPNGNERDPAWKLRSTFHGRFIGRPDNPDFVREAVAWGKAQIDAGVDTIVCDDFFGYRSREAKRLFSKNVIEAIKAHKPGFTIAGNNGGFIGTRYVKPYAFDFHYLDSGFVPGPGAWWPASKLHRALKSAFLIHPNVHMSKETRRKLIALGYANRAHVIVPWDEYTHGKNKGRIFADPADFADRYGFARAFGQKGGVNGYEDAAVGDYDLTETRYPAPPITVNGGSGKLSVFARAKPGRVDKLVVLHLVEWGTAQAATLRIRRGALFGRKNVGCVLFTPPPYSEAAHKAAESSGEYGSLCQASVLEPRAEDDVVVIDVPPVKPWSVLVVGPGSQRLGGRSAKNVQ